MTLTFESPALPVRYASELPHGWQFVALGRLLSVKNGADYKADEVTDGGYPVIGSGGEFARSSSYGFDGESVLFGRKGTIDRPLHVSGRFWTVDTMFYTVIGPRLVSRFLYYFATTVDYGYYATNTAVPSMTQRDIATFKVPLPPVETQQQIADYLDAQTAKIDALVGKQEQLIETLAERRGSVIDHAVWCGFRGESCRPSGVDPAPEAPASWKRVRNKYLFAERVELSIDGQEELLTVSHLSGVTLRSEKNVNMILAESFVGYKLVRPHDLVINTLWAWMGALGSSITSGIVSPAYGVYRPIDVQNFEARYFHHLYRSTAYISEMTRFSKGVWSSRLRLYPESFLNLWTVIPPLDEQQDIADYIDCETSKIDTLSAKAREMIDILKERRQALISAAVTGKIDVRGLS